MAGAEASRWTKVESAARARPPLVCGPLCSILNSWGEYAQRRLEAETAWIEQQRRLWDARFDQLEQVVAQPRRKEQVDGHPKRR